MNTNETKGTTHTNKHETGNVQRKHKPHINNAILTKQYINHQKQHQRQDTRSKPLQTNKTTLKHQRNKTNTNTNKQNKKNYITQKTWNIRKPTHKQTR